MSITNLLPFGKSAESRAAQVGAITTLDDAINAASQLGRIELKNPTFGGLSWEAEIAFTTRSGLRVYAKSQHVSALIAMTGCINEALRLGAEPRQS